MSFVRRDTFTDLFHDMTRLQEQFGRMFGGLSLSNLVRHLPGTGGNPLANVWDDEHTIFVELDLPGLAVDKLDITVRDGNHLTIQGERTALAIKKAVWQRQERPVGQFTRVLTLPALVDSERVEAKFEDGVLKLTLPKSEAAKPRKIQVIAG